MKYGKHRSPQKKNAHPGKRLAGHSARSQATARARNRTAHIRRIPDDRRTEETVQGVFSGTGRGFGFLHRDDGADDLFIPAHCTAGALDGDRVSVRVRYQDTYDGRPEGQVLRILEQGRSTVIGTLCEGRWLNRRARRGGMGNFFVIPDDTRLPIKVRVTPTPESRTGDKVEVRLRRRTQSDPDGEIVRVFGPASSLHANYESILAETGVPVEFDPFALEQAEAEARRPLTDRGRTRRDHEIIFTIDGEDAKDLDDAVSLRQLAGGKWLLGVHIADVSCYVPERTALDRAAMERGTSVYFIDRVVPMLPPCLSNGACSLNPNEDRYALSAYLTLAPDGDLISCRVEPSIIRSRVRGVYSEVNDLFENGARSPYYAKYRTVYPSLQKMHRLYTLLHEAQQARGAMELDRPEAKIIMNEKGEPVDIVCRERGDAERLIEQFMLCANRGVATLLTERGIPCVYRVHDAPLPEKLGELAVYLKGMGFDTAFLRKEKLDTRDFSALLEQARERGTEHAVSYALLRAMAKAVYSPQATGHFGLQAPLYCHFTSPIRRLSDLAVHRIIHKVLLEGQPPRRYADYAKRAAAAATDTELRAMEAERRIEELYKCLYMERFVGTVFPARVSSVTGFGMFCELENTCEGMIPLAELPGMFVFDQAHQTLSCGTTVFRPGDPVQVRLEECEPNRGRMRFSLAGRETVQA